jgi:hypothetical protein
MSTRARPSIASTSQAGLAARTATLAATHGPAVLVVVLAFWLTVPYTQADSPGYASEIVQYRDVALLSEGNVLWEFGHLIWRPIGWALFRS